jgi:hypothetical protein
MPYAEIAAALSVVAYIELRVQRTLREAAEQLERDYMDNGGRRRATRATTMREERANRAVDMSQRER